MPATVEDAQTRAFLLGDAREEPGPFQLCAANFEMRGTRPAERATAEEGATEVRGPAARTCDDTLGRVLERRQPRAQHAGFVQHLQGAVVACDMKLVTRAPFEGAATVRPDLRADAERSQEAERATSYGRIDDVEMDRDLASSLQMFASRGVKEPR